MKTTPRTAFLLCLTAAAAMTGCKREVTVDDPRLAEAHSELYQAQSCEDLESRLREDALARIDMQMDAYLLMADQFDDSDWGGGWGSDDAMAESGDSNGSDGGESASATGGFEGGPTSGDDGGRDESAPPEHSDTNNQVEGVDEADIVKTDGDRLYVLSGTAFTVLQAWPASALAIEQSIGLEGQPLEMFVEGDKAVIFAQVDGTSIYAAAGVEPKQPYYGGGYYDGGMGDCYDCYGPQNTLTQVLVLDLAGGAPTVEREYFFEGSYLSSRREADQVRVVINGGAHGPGVDEYPMCEDGCDSSDDWTDAVEAARERARARVLGASLEDYTSVRFQRAGGVVTVLDAACTGYWVPTAGSSEYGLTQVEQIDLGNAAAGPSHTAIVGAAQTVYANESTLILAGASYDVSRYIGYLPTTESVVLNSTHLHRFDLDADPSRPSYTGSSTVPGYLIDQFALDERNGTLRVATHVTTQNDVEWSESNALYTVDVATNSVIGSVEHLAEGEQMYSARFVGDRGYFVTFRQTDPLFVFDISDPSSPVKKAELHIPGFSEYMHPMDDGQFLLTIGQDGTLDGTSGTIALQIFDVRDAANPILAHKLPLDANSSEALYNHKAFTFWQGMLAIPFESWDDMGNYATELGLFNVDAETGITEKGRIDHSQFYELGSEYNYCFPGGVRRGVFIEDFVYSVSSGGVAVHDLADLQTPVASVSLPEFDAATYCDGYYY